MLKEELILEEHTTYFICYIYFINNNFIESRLFDKNLNKIVQVKSYNLSLLRLLKNSVQNT